MNRHPSMRRLIAIVNILVWTSAVLLAQTTAPANAKLTVSGDVGQPLTLSLDDLKGMPRTTVEIKDDDGRTQKYDGVLVGEILKRAGVSLGSALRGNAISTYVVAS